VSSCACEQTEENANMLFAMSAMRNVQKHRRDHVGVSSGKMNWSSLVTMSYAICRYVLTCGGVPRITWEVHSGLIVRKVVPSVRGCLTWGISEWGCVFSRLLVVCDRPLSIRKVVLSVRGCLMWEISEWGCFVWRISWLPISGLLHEWVESVPEWADSSHGWKV
jgi:hypothetical protein